MRRAWTRLRYNWFVIGLGCATNGHDWREQRISRCSAVTACAKCGNYRGVRRMTDECRYYCPCRKVTGQGSR